MRMVEHASQAPQASGLQGDHGEWRTSPSSPSKRAELNRRYGEEVALRVRAELLASPIAAQRYVLVPK